MGLRTSAVALHRATRAAVVIPAVFALTLLVIRDLQVATFAVFGCFGLLVMADFGGPRRSRAVAYAATALAGAALVAIGSVVSFSAAAAAIVMIVVGFTLSFSGVFGGYLAAAQTALLLAFVLSASIAAPVSAIPTRLAGWVIAAVVSTLAGVFFWLARSPGTARPFCRRRHPDQRAEVLTVRGRDGTELRSRLGHRACAFRDGSACEAIAESCARPSTEALQVSITRRHECDTSLMREEQDLGRLRPACLVRQVGCGVDRPDASVAHASATYQCGALLVGYDIRPHGEGPATDPRDRHGMKATTRWHGGQVGHVLANRHTGTEQRRVRRPRHVGDIVDVQRVDADEHNAGGEQPLAATPRSRRGCRRSNSRCPSGVRIRCEQAVPCRGDRLRGAHPGQSRDPRWSRRSPQPRGSQDARAEVRRGQFHRGIDAEVRRRMSRYCRTGAVRR